MSFKKDIPNYKSVPDGELYMQTVPSGIWISIESLIRKSASNADKLKAIINTIAEITGGHLTNNWGWGFLENDIPQCVSDIRRKTEKGKVYHFESLMDSLAVLVNIGDLSCDDLNEFLEDNEIGYCCEKSFGGQDIVWYRVDSEESKTCLKKNEHILKMINNQINSKVNNDGNIIEDNHIKRSDIEIGEKSLGALEDKVNSIKNTHTKPSVFISYNWGSEKTADDVEIKLKDIAEVRRDKNSIKPWGSINGFMKEIRKTDLVIVIISDEYLKSVNCLFEIMQLIKDESWITHSMFIVEESAKKIYKPIGQLDYVKYWEKEREILKNAIKDLDPALVTTLAEELNKIDIIRLNIGLFLKMVADCNNPSISKSIDAIIGRVKDNSREQETEGDQRQLIFNKPIFEVKISAINKSIPGTSEWINIWDGSIALAHKNVQLNVKLYNDVIIRNIKVFGKNIETGIMKRNKTYIINVCYKESPDIRWEKYVVKLSRELYPAGEDGIPQFVLLEYNLNNNIYQQRFALNDDNVYLPVDID